MICGKCKAPAEAVETVKACHAGETFACGDLVPEGYDECGSLQVAECGAHARATDDMGSWACENGHAYLSMEARFRSGQEYAECEDEAAALAAAGISPILTGPSLPLFIGAGA